MIPQTRTPRLVQPELVRHAPRSGELVYRCPLCGPDDQSGHLYLNPDSGVWHCYRCGQGGNVSWLRHKTGIDFPLNEGPNARTTDAVADMLSGVVDAGVLALLRGTEQAAPQKFDGEDYAKISPDAHGWFSRKAGDLFGLGEPNYSFKLGNTPDSWWECDLDAAQGFEWPLAQVFDAVRYMRHRGYDKATAAAWRIFVPTDPRIAQEAKTRYGRLVIPAIHPRAGCVTSFMARALTSKQWPKYIGPYTRSAYPSLIFSPGALVKASIKVLREVVLVEGPFDALAVARAGYDVAALSGKALTQEGAQMLKDSGVELVVVMLDSDSATAWHGISRRLFNMGIDTMITWIPPRTKDPGDMEDAEIDWQMSVALPAWQALAVGFGEKFS
jgi:hypothetical protein